MSGEVLLALLAVVLAGCGGRADTETAGLVVGHAETEQLADRMITTTTTSASTTSPAVKYLPSITPVQEPADPCKAGNYIMSTLCLSVIT